MSMKTETESALDTYNGTLLLAALELEERTEDPCEHSEHEKRTHVHGGPGEWLVRSDHTCFAKKKARHVLLCDKFVTAIMSGTLLIMCKACGDRDMDPNEVYTILGRKGVDF